jgi:hypothetical protein
MSENSEAKTGLLWATQFGREKLFRCRLHNSAAKTVSLLAPQLQ